MATSSPGDFTQLLVACNQGDAAAFAQLTQWVDQELRKLAKSYLGRERANHTLQPTALVNEAYLRLLKGKPIQWESREHFFGVMAKVMRHILVDWARRKKGQAIKVTLNNSLPLGAGNTKVVDLLALDEALQLLHTFDPLAVSVFELRYFLGATQEETAHVLNITIDKVKKRWNKALPWILNRLP